MRRKRNEKGIASYEEVSILQMDSLKRDQGAPERPDGEVEV